MLDVLNCKKDANFFLFLGACFLRFLSYDCCLVCMLVTGTQDLATKIYTDVEAHCRGWVISCNSKASQTTRGAFRPEWIVIIEHRPRKMSPHQFFCINFHFLFLKKLLLSYVFVRWVFVEKRHHLILILSLSLAWEKKEKEREQYLSSVLLFRYFRFFFNGLDILDLISLVVTKIFYKSKFANWWEWI